jgi:hypothetical protein
MQYLKKFCDLKLKKYNYLNCSVIWFDLIEKCWIGCEIWFGLSNKLFNSVIWIEFVKKNWIEKDQFGTKTQILSTPEVVIHTIRVGGWGGWTYHKSD